MKTNFFSFPLASSDILSNHPIIPPIDSKGYAGHRPTDQTSEISGTRSARHGLKIGELWGGRQKQPTQL
jgi:hypothetical protein